MQKFALPSLMFLLITAGIMLTASKQNNPTIEFTGTAKLSGYISDETFGTPVTNAKITLDEKKWFQTDEAGFYAIDKLEAGNYKLQIYASGYDKKTIDFSINAGEIRTLDLQLAISKPEINADKPVIRENKQVDGITMEGQESDEATDINYLVAPAYKISSDANEDIYINDDYEHNTEAYNTINENTFKQVIGNPLSTFSIDVDNASYSNIRRMINYGQTPPKDAVRVEEMLNYFDYTYAQPKGNEPFAINYEMSECAWNPESKIVMIGLQGKDIDYSEAKASNLVFLIDVSGSMAAQNKLPLVISSLNSLVDNLNERDKVALVVYAGAAGEVLPSTPCNQKATIKAALNNLQAGGSTAGGAGIALAYDIADKNLIEGGNNRVILCTDGDFNVGASSDAEMTKLMEEKREKGIFITICGFGMGNYKDSKMETMADNGNGAYYYIDGENEAKKVFTTDMRGTLFTIAKDVKIQIEFNPALVESYRLIGYENRQLNKEDFDDDKKDAGELGAGHRVTAMYEIKLRKGTYQPSGIKTNTTTEDLKYQTTTIKSDAYNTDEIMSLKMRYKTPEGSNSMLIEKSLYKNVIPFASTSYNFRFASAVVEFGMLLRDSPFKGDATYDEAIKLANSALGKDVNGYRNEFVELIKTFNGFAQQK